ncbi:V-type ATPase 116kDa subunit [Popillia japonica]|uniref:V-type proton ATPase subunit a n=1 Tax=Popillia japonica TaxID=7064 RepID=A0AAW1MLK4_POPJA
MVLFKPAKENPPCSPEMFDGQFALQKVLVVLALLCVPVMLLAKPIIILRSQNKSTEYSMQQATENGDAEQPIQNNTAQTQAASGGHGGGHGEHENAGELFIHQGIHTIEFVLGSVSHTASYLRLWALSLAHAQLSEVLWNMVLSKGLTMFDDWKGGIALYVIFSAWACLTVSILVLMEGLSAFLHTLRLHWVEFQSKFYAGLGHGFQPFSFELLLDPASGTGETD